MKEAKEMRYEEMFAMLLIPSAYMSRAGTCFISISIKVYHKGHKIYAYMSVLYPCIPMHYHVNQNISGKIRASYNQSHMRRFCYSNRSISLSLYSQSESP